MGGLSLSAGEMMPACVAASAIMSGNIKHICFNSLCTSVVQVFIGEIFLITGYCSYRCLLQLPNLDCGKFVWLFTCYGLTVGDM